MEIINNSRTKSIDLGKIEFKDHLGNSSHRYFINIASFGLGGEVANRVNKSSKIFGGFISFIWATVTALMTYKKTKINIRIDSNIHREVNCWHVAVANGQYQGGGMWVAPEAKLDDGLFHISIIGDLTLMQVFLNLHMLYNGRINQVKKVETLVGKKIIAQSAEPVLLDMDGEQPGTLPVTISMLPSQLNFITLP